MQGLRGLQGLQGQKGERGEQGSVILGYYNSLQELINAHPTGQTGESYLVGDGDLYVWDASTNSWKLSGSLQGPQGEKGEKGTFDPEEPLFTLECPQGLTDVNFKDVLKLESDTLDIKAEGNVVSINADKSIVHQFNSIQQARVHQALRERVLAFAPSGLARIHLYLQSIPLL